MTETRTSSAERRSSRAVVVTMALLTCAVLMLSGLASASDARLSVGSSARPVAAAAMTAPRVTAATSGTSSTAPSRSASPSPSAPQPKAGTAGQGPSVAGTPSPLGDPLCVSNGYLAVAIVPPPTGAGVFTFAVGGCPVNLGDSSSLILYPEDSFFSVRVDDTSDLYVEGDCFGIVYCGSSEDGYTVINLDTQTPTVTLNSSTEVIISWIASAEDLRILQDIQVVGSRLADSQIVQRVSVENLGATSHTVQIRVLEDSFVGGYDGTWIRTYSGTTPGTIYGNETDFDPPASTFTAYAMSGCEGAPPCTPTNFGSGTFTLFGSISSPAGVTTPARFVYAWWAATHTTAFDYTADPDRAIGSGSPDVGGSYDSSELYYSPTEVVGPGATDNFVTAVGTSPNAIAEKSVTFTESGLPAGRQWSVTLGGETQSSTTSTIVFGEPNGTYNYVVGEVHGYTASPSTGSVGVLGANASVAVAFSSAPYTVTFSETGLPAGHLWTAVLAGVPETTSNASLNFSVQDGSYDFSVPPVAHNTASPSSGTLEVDGADVLESVEFTVTTYTVTFTETGLPTGTDWSVWLNGTTEATASTSLQFSELNGSYPFVVEPVAGFSIDPRAGTVNVSGADVGVSVRFYQPESYTITFVESGLPSGTGWSVYLNNTTATSTSNEIALSERNGSYLATFDTVIPGWRALPNPVWVTVNGSAVVVTVAFEAVFNVEFAESGLPDGVEWYACFSGDNFSSCVGYAYGGPGSELETNLSNGSYLAMAYTFNGSYVLNPAEVAFTVAGAAQVVDLHFERVTFTVTFTESGLPAKKLARTGWTVVWNGTLYHATTDVVSIAGVVAGNYWALITGPSGYRASGSQMWNVVGSSDFAVSMTKGRTVALSFHEKGLRGVPWCTVLDGYEVCTAKKTLKYTDLAPGSYDYEVLPVSGESVTAKLGGNAIPLSGTLTISKNTPVKLDYTSTATHGAVRTTGGLEPAAVRKVD